ncbi:MAG: DUF3795 domain-containing protein [Sphaerochaeta sp.]|uniref:DUF3795 domain-containing protein n=1 Tax=Sphaerochaeta sp. TaxID=1972642 RepID=UPI002975939D|nr:DUF3795 domain-containing protein [Sphaerochaeta sp.]
MDKQKGIAFCGLACCLCEEKPSCKGCRQGDCPDAQGCKAYQCAVEKGHAGCWECTEFPCDFTLFSSLRIRTFASYVARYGQDALLAALHAGEQNGLHYHYQGKLVGDYDKVQDEVELFALLDSLK